MTKALIFQDKEQLEYVIWSVKYVLENDLHPLHDDGILYNRMKNFLKYMEEINNDNKKGMTDEQIMLVLKELVYDQD